MSKRKDKMKKDKEKKKEGERKKSLNLVKIVLQI